MFAWRMSTWRWWGATWQPIPSKLWAWPLTVMQDWMPYLQKGETLLQGWWWGINEEVTPQSAKLTRAWNLDCHDRHLVQVLTDQTKQDPNILNHGGSNSAVKKDLGTLADPRRRQEEKQTWNQKEHDNSPQERDLCYLIGPLAKGERTSCLGSPHAAGSEASSSANVSCFFVLLLSCPMRWTLQLQSLDGPNRHCQSPVFSESGQLSQAIPQFHVEGILHKWFGMNANRAIWITARWMQGLWGLVSVCLEGIWPPMNASDSNCSDNSR